MSRIGSASGGASSFHPMPELQGLEGRVLQSGFWKTLTQRLTLSRALRIAALPPDADVLEVGSGGGSNAEVLLQRFAAGGSPPPTMPRDGQRSAFFPPPAAKLFLPMSHYSIQEVRAAIPEAGFARWWIHPKAHPEPAAQP